MMNKVKEQMKDVKLLVLNLIIVILAVVLVIAAIMTAAEIYDTYTSYYYKDSSFVYSMESEDYGRVVSMYHENCANGYGEKKDLQEYYGVAKYYEAAFYYKMYLDAGDSERMAIQKNLMEEAAAQMGEFAFMRTQISEKLGLEE